MGGVGVRRAGEDNDETPQKKRAAQGERSSDDYYIKSICPSGDHGRGHRLALQNRAAARHVYR